jgi:hypothetical protein
MSMDHPQWQAAHLVPAPAPAPCVTLTPRSWFAHRRSLPPPRPTRSCPDTALPVLASAAPARRRPPDRSIARPSARLTARPPTRLTARPSARLTARPPARLPNRESSRGPRPRLRGHRPERAFAAWAVPVQRFRSGLLVAGTLKIMRVLRLLCSFDGSGPGVCRRVCEILESLGPYVGVTLQGLEIRCETVATKANDTDESTVLFRRWSTMQTFLAR